MAGFAEQALDHALGLYVPGLEQGIGGAPIGIGAAPFVVQIRYRDSLTGAKAAFLADPQFGARWQARLAAEPTAAAERQQAMLRTNPAVIPRNHLVEEALAAAAERDDLKPFEALLAVLRSPFAPPADPRYALPAADGMPGYQTFCGT